MIPVHPAHRRAAAFDAAIEGSSTAGLDARTHQLVELVGALRTIAGPAARPAFVADLREQLMLAAATELVPAPAPPVRRPPTPARARRERRITTAIGGLAILGATASMAVAAQTALPGDTLYPVKRAIENADTGLRPDTSRGPQLLEQATSRLGEVDALNQRNGGTTDARSQSALERTLQTFGDQSAAASTSLLDQFAESGDEQSVITLKDFTSTSLSRLAGLEPALPPSLRPALLDAAQTLVVINQAAAAACPTCVGTAITEVPPALVSAVNDPRSTTPQSSGLVEAPPVVPAAPVPGRKPRATSRPATAPPAAPTTPGTTGSTGNPKPPTATTGGQPTSGSTGGGSGGGSGDGTVLGDLGNLLGGTPSPAAPTPAVPAPTPTLPVVGDLLGDPLLP